MKTKSATPALIRFDWAIKRLLRQKANYKVLEGFLTVVLNEEVKIINIKESESNQSSAIEKLNRVDILVKNKQGELIIIELQNSEEVDYFLRMLCRVSKTITEHISLGDIYSKLRKVYHINIVYFKLGQGKDYVYHGITEFKGLHCHDVLELTEEQKNFFAEPKRKNVHNIKDLFPEDYMLFIEEFNNVVKDSLDEWIYYFKNNQIPDSFTAPGLNEAKELLKYDLLSDQEKMDYEHHINQRLYEKGAIETALRKGEAIGLEKGLVISLEKRLAKGEEDRARLQAEKEAVQAEIEAIQAEIEAVQAELKQKEIDTVIKSHQAGVMVETISTITGLSIEEILMILEREFQKK